MKKTEFIKLLKSKGIDFNVTKKTIEITNNQGYVDLESCTTLPEGVQFNNQGYVYLRSCTTLPEGIKVIDNYGMIVNSRKTTKGIIIYDCNFLGNKKHSFVAEKDGFTAHGETVKKAINDLNFKIVSEKLKNEPIYMDTIVNDNYYRILTGACELGVKSWRESNNVTVEEITVKELLPILERTNAYGVEKFKSLIQSK